MEFAFAHAVRGPLTALPYFFTDDADKPCCRIQLSKLFMLVLFCCQTHTLADY